MDKKIVEVTVRMPEYLKRDMQDLADHDDRTLSEAIRIALSTHLYGLKNRHEVPVCAGSSCPTSRGAE